MTLVPQKEVKSQRACMNRFMSPPQEYTKYTHTSLCIHPPTFTCVHGLHTITHTCTVQHTFTQANGTFGHTKHTSRLTHALRRSHTLFLTRKHTHMLSDMSSVHVTILSTPEAGSGGGGGGGWRGGGLCCSEQWLVVAIPTREGHSQRLLREELQTYYKALPSSSLCSTQLPAL